MGSDTDLVEASDYLPFPHIPDEGTVTRRGPCYAVQIAFKNKEKQRIIACAHHSLQLAKRKLQVQMQNL